MHPAQELRPIPTGSPQFMIGMGEGKTRPLLYLYDTGCGSVLFRDRVPQKELSGCTLKTKGPFTVKGVGGTAVTVNDVATYNINLCRNTDILTCDASQYCEAVRLLMDTTPIL